MSFTLHCTTKPDRPKEQWAVLALCGEPIVFATEAEALAKGTLLATKGISEFVCEARPVEEVPNSQK